MFMTPADLAALSNRPLVESLPRGSRGSRELARIVKPSTLRDLLRSPRRH